MDYSNAMPLTDDDWRVRTYEALDIFSPGAPIDEFDLLAGRGQQIDQLIETVFQRGQHAILFGERGVGKSSLANTFATRILGRARTLSCIPVNCHPSDDFSSVWRKVFRRLEVDGTNIATLYQDREIDPDEVVLELSNFSLNTVPIVILDEFDQLTDRFARNLIANAIKNLSDRSVRATVILVGVADSVSDLIDEHESILRCLRQIHMQRMTYAELREIVDGRLPRLGMSIDPDGLSHIVSLSRGLPHYTHLLGQRAAKTALDARSLRITLPHIEHSIPECIEQTSQSLRKQYHEATTSPRRENIYSEVLLACALAQVDALGYFAPVDIKIALSALLQREAPVSLYGQHLKSLCTAERGSVLEQMGSERRYRYRFVEPMMQPFVLMQGLRNGLITRRQVEELAATHYEPRFSSEF